MEMNAPVQTGVLCRALIGLVEIRRRDEVPSFFVPDACCSSRDGSHDRGMWRREMDTRERQDIRKERNKQHLPNPHAGGPESAEGMSQTFTA